MGYRTRRETGITLVSIVNLASGGLDSTLVSVLINEQGLELHPLFLDYGQLAAHTEWAACQHVHAALELPSPTRMDISGFGSIIRSGLTSAALDIHDDAFTPTRNLVFLVMAAAFAHQVGADTVAIGLLAERFSLFPDQRAEFVRNAATAVASALNRQIKLVTPLIDFSKADVIQLAQSKGIAGTYSCHSGTPNPCGRCIACHEFGILAEDKSHGR